MQLIVGLGNPGKDYARTRHNAGFIVLDYVANKDQITISNRERLCLTGSGEIENQLVTLAKPRTYMNLSGEAVRRLTTKYNVKPESIIVIHDDLDLKTGQIRLRRGGSSAGHKGINSIIRALGTLEFIRLRIGIGRPDNNTTEEDIVDYVLGNFTSQEATLMEKSLPRISEALKSLLTDGIDIAMNRFNRFFTPT